MPKRAFLHGLLAGTHKSDLVQRETVVPDFVGRCLNLDYCALGDARSVVRINPGAAFVCPECGHELATVEAWQQPREARLIASGVLVMACGAAIGFYAMHGPARPHRNQQASHHVAAHAPARLLAAAPAVRKIAPPVAPPKAMPVVVTELASAVFIPEPPPVTEVLSSAVFTPEPVETRVISSAVFEPAPVHVVLRLAGAGRHGAGLLGDFARAFLARHASDIRTSEDQPDRILIQGSRGARHDGIVLMATDSAAGYAALARGDSDLALADRPPTQAERARLPKALALEEVAGVAGGSAPARQATAARQTLILAGPGAKSGPAAQDFLRFAASAVGQESVARDGFIRIPASSRLAKADRQADTATQGVVSEAAPEKAAAVHDAVTATPAAAAAAKPVTTADQGNVAQELDGFETETESTHVFTLPASAHMVFGGLDKVSLPATAAKPPSADEAMAHLPPPSPVNGVLEADCAIELTGVPNDCRIVRVRGTRSGVDAVMGWLVSGQVKYAPSLKNGRPAVERRVLVVNYQPPKETP